MTPQAALILVQAYTESVRVWGKVFDAMSPGAREEFADVIAKREVWWQENLWDPAGDVIAEALQKLRGDEESDDA